MLANAVGVLAYLMIPRQMWSAVAERYGVVGTLPSLVTDGGAAVLAVAMLVVLVRYRATWAQTPEPVTAGGRRRG